MTDILVIDDEPRVGAALRFALAPHGFSVHQEVSAVAALKRVTKVRPDCILLDVGLQDADGLELCREIKASAAAQVPLLLLTGRVDAASVARGLEAGADDYVSKPFTARELRARIEAHLRHASQGRHA